MNSQILKKKKIPDKPGVYFFVKGRDILYIGKATSLKDRVKSYFGRDLINTRGPLILDMITIATSIKWQVTDSVLEALILEANLIKKYQPKYNTKEKDNKSFNYVCITDENIPKIKIERGRNLDKNKYKNIFGPFPKGTELKEAMKIIRRIFPYIDDDSIKKNNKEFYKQLGLVPSNDYKNNLKKIKLLFEGKKKNIIFGLKKEMINFAKKKEFEKAGEVKKKIFALLHINDVALIKENKTSQNYENFSVFTPKGPYADKNFHNSAPQLLRIEAYDIAHMSGKNMVGVMTVIEDGEINRKEYRKFLIKSQSKANDTGALREVLSRRFAHSEWSMPNLIVVDGGIAQINVVGKIIKGISVVSVVKDDKHKAKAIMGDENIIKKYKKEILLANNEAHRFAITFHKARRDKNFLK